MLTLASWCNISRRLYTVIYHLASHSTEYKFPINLASFAALQPVVEPVRMEGPWIQEPVHVAVWVASVEITVKVSAL